MPVLHRKRSGDCPRSPGDRHSRYPTRLTWTLASASPPSRLACLALAATSSLSRTQLSSAVAARSHLDISAVELLGTCLVTE